MTHFAHGGRPWPILLTPGLRAELRRVGPFLGVGLVGFAVDAGLFAVLHGAGLSRAAARAVSLLVATAVTFGLNRSFTFAASGPGAPGRVQGGRDGPGQFLRYGAVTLVAQGFSYGLFLLLATRLPNLAALSAGAAAATAFSFAGQRLFTFRETGAPGPGRAGGTPLRPGLLRPRRARRRPGRT